jgi:hypothetical protein
MSLPSENFRLISPSEAAQLADGGVCSFCGHGPDSERQMVAIDMGRVSDEEGMPGGKIITVRDQLAGRTYRLNTGYGEREHVVNFALQCNVCVADAGRPMGIVPAGPLLQKLEEAERKLEQAERKIAEQGAELEQRRQAQPVIDLIAKQVAEQGKAKPRKPTSPAAA